MASLLVDYRSDVFNILAGAVDASKWTPTMIDAALRLALNELNSQLVYEVSFTVITTGYQHDLTTITAINAVLGVAYPWQDGYEFGHAAIEWRTVGNNLIYLIGAQATSGEIIRVRYSKLHAIQNLDAAVATTVPDANRVLVGLWAAAYACEMRLRQAGELSLASVAIQFRERAQNALSHVPPLGRLRWATIGLD